MPENVFDKISRAYYELTAAEKRTADYLLANRESCHMLSIAQLAEKSGVAEATISRFCRSLGYKSFHAFKIALAGAAYSAPAAAHILSGPVEPGDTREEMFQKIYSAEQDALRQTLDLADAEMIRKSVDCLEKAPRVLLMGQGGSMLMAREAQHVFSTVSGKFIAVEDSHSQMVAATGMQKGEVILFFSYSGATRDMMDVLKLARKRKAAVILITRFPGAPGAALADIVLTCGSHEGPLQLGSVPAKIAQLFLIDLLFSEYCRRNLEECRKSRERVAAAMAVKHLP